MAGCTVAVGICTVAVLSAVATGTTLANDEDAEHEDRDEALDDIRARWVTCCLGFAVVIVRVALALALVAVWDLGWVMGSG